MRKKLSSLIFKRNVKNGRHLWFFDNQINQTKMKMFKEKKVLLGDFKGKVCKCYFLSVFFFACQSHETNFDNTPTFFDDPHTFCIFSDFEEKRYYRRTFACLSNIIT